MPPIDVLTHHAQKTPDKLAVIDDRPGQPLFKLTFAELNARVNRLGHVLLARGVKPGDKIVWCGMNSIGIVAMMHAARKIGATAVPLNYRLTPDEAAYVVDHCDAALVWVDAEFAPLIAQIRGQTPKLRDVLVFDGEPGEGALDADPLVAAADADEPGGGLGGRQSETMIYTSGTTGRPKGALRQGIGDPEQVRRMIELIGYRPDDVYLTTGPLYHSGPGGFMILSQNLGGTVVLQRRFEPEDWLRLVAKHRVTTTFSAPTPIRMVCNLPAEVKARYDVSSMQRMVANAAPWSYALKEQYLANFPENSLWEVYGSTELGVNSILEPQDQRRKKGSCGKPAPTVEIKLFDDEGEEVTQPHVPGELYVRSKTVFTTYYKAHDKYISGMAHQVADQMTQNTLLARKVSRPTLAATLEDQTRSLWREDYFGPFDPSIGGRRSYSGKILDQVEYGRFQQILRSDDAVVTAVKNQFGDNIDEAIAHAQRQRQQLLDQFERDFPKSPRITEACLSLMNLHAGSNDPRRTVEYAEKAIKSDPETVSTLVQVSRMYAGLQTQMEKALQYTEKAATLARGLEKQPVPAGENAPAWQAWAASMNSSARRIVRGVDVPARRRRAAAVRGDGERVQPHAARRASGVRGALRRRRVRRARLRLPLLRRLSRLAAPALPHPAAAPGLALGDRTRSGRPRRRRQPDHRLGLLVRRRAPDRGRGARPGARRGGARFPVRERAAPGAPHAPRRLRVGAAPGDRRLARPPHDDPGHRPRRQQGRDGVRRGAGRVRAHGGRGLAVAKRGLAGGVRHPRLPPLGRQGAVHHLPAVGGDRRPRHHRGQCCRRSARRTRSARRGPPLPDGPLRSPDPRRRRADRRRPARVPRPGRPVSREGGGGNLMIRAACDPLSS
jgi:fatty-acyl-CoA synthase/long-chain acyl-CoA synthetase